MSSFIVLNGFLQKHSAIDKKDLLKPLSINTQEIINSTFSPPSPIDSNKFSPKSLLDEVHYSWFIDFLNPFTSKEQSLFISSFKDETKQKLKDHFKISKDIVVSPIALDFLKKKLFDQLIENQKEILPQEYLPNSELHFLLDLSKYELSKLIDYLSLYDLALELPKIVNNEILNKINEYLSIEKKQFLQTKKNYKERFSFPKMKLEQAISSSKEFNILLHKRGLNRFAKALCQEHISLIWYICHKLDKGRGEILYNFCKDKEETEIIKSITFNIMELLPIIKKKK
jgi:hypothetical protein